MFSFINNMKQARDERRAAKESAQRQRLYEQQRAQEYAEARDRKIESVRILTGELKHRYVIVDALRGFGHYIAPEVGTYDPLEATRRATLHLQTQAADIDADAVIHARFEIIRYTENRGARYSSVPVYEVHAFGTAVRIVGPSPDLDGAFDSSESPGV